MTHLTPSMIRVTLTGPDLDGFRSAAFDDHVKLFFPRPGETEPYLPAAAPGDRAAAGEAEKPIARDYTPRRFDPAAHTLDIDFALHEAGPATRWALEAAPGRRLGVGGPRGSFVVADDFDWYLLAGDETALPAIGRRLEELPPGTRAIVLAEVADAGEEQAFATRADLDLRWVYRGGASPGGSRALETALEALVLPPGEGFAWIAAEAEAAKRLRRIAVERHRQPTAWLRAAGYWRRGAANVHETIAD